MFPAIISQYPFGLYIAVITVLSEVFRVPVSFGPDSAVQIGAILEEVAISLLLIQVVFTFNLTAPLIISYRYCDRTIN